MSDVPVKYFEKQ